MAAAPPTGPAGPVMNVFQNTSGTGPATQHNNGTAAAAAGSSGASGSSGPSGSSDSDHDKNTVYTHHGDIKAYFEASWAYVEEAVKAAEADVATKVQALEDNFDIEYKDDSKRLDRHRGMIELFVEWAASQHPNPGLAGVIYNKPEEGLQSFVDVTYPAGPAPANPNRDTQINNLPKKRIENIEAIKAAQEQLVKANNDRLDLLKAFLTGDNKKNLEKGIAGHKELATSLNEATLQFVEKLKTINRNGPHIPALLSLLPGQHANWQADDIVKEVETLNLAWRTELHKYRDPGDVSGPTSEFAPGRLWKTYRPKDMNKMKAGLEAKLYEPVRKPYGETVGPGEKWTIAEVKKQLDRAETLKTAYVTGEKNRFEQLKPLRVSAFFRGFCFPPCSSSTPFRLLDLCRASGWGMLFYFVFNMLFVVALYGITLGGEDHHWQRLYIALLTTNDDNKQVLFGGRLCTLTGTDIQSGSVSDCATTGLRPQNFNGIGEVPGLRRWELQSYWLLWLLPIIYGILFANDLFRLWLVWRYQSGTNLKKKHIFACKWNEYQQKVFDVVNAEGKKGIEAKLNGRDEKVDDAMRGAKAKRKCGGKVPGRSEFTTKLFMCYEDNKTVAAINAIWNESVKQTVREASKAIEQAWVYMPTSTFPPALGAFVVALTQMVLIAWIITIYISTMDNLKDIAKQSNATVQLGAWANRIYALTLVRIMFDMYTAVGSLMYAVHDEYCTALRAYRQLDQGDFIKNTFTAWKGGDKEIEVAQKQWSWERKEVDPTTAARLLAQASVVVYRERFWGARYYNNSINWVWRVVSGRGHDFDATDVDIPPIWVAPDIGGEKLKWYTGADLKHSTRYYVFPGYTAKRLDGRTAASDGYRAHRRGAGDL